MNKIRLAFIDHAFHRKTKSSNFFVRLLIPEFDVDIYHLEDDPRDQLLLIKDNYYDIILCWQTEFCAPFFILNQFPVICIPMYDGVENVPDWYWIPMRQARFISFSKILHLRLKKMGIESSYVQYYGDYNIRPPKAEFDSLKGFFWQRRPQEGLDYKFARKVFSVSPSNKKSEKNPPEGENYNGLIVSSLHIHNAPDEGDPLDWEPDITCTVSEFSHNPEIYNEFLSKSNVFLCPRKTEGIGLAMIEALARGMCVIANDAPTANEYIIHNVNGLLIDYNQSPFLDLDLSKARRMGEKAREIWLRKSKEWLSLENYLRFYVKTAPTPSIDFSMQKYRSAYLEISRLYYTDNPNFMFNLQNLIRSGFMNSDPKSVSRYEQVKFKIKRVPGVLFIYRKLKKIIIKIKYLVFL